MHAQMWMPKAEKHYRENEEFEINEARVIVHNDLDRKQLYSGNLGLQNELDMIGPIAVTVNHMSL